MRNEHDERLDALFAAARRLPPDTEHATAHFETRVLARLAEQREQYTPWLLVWRALPVFATVTAIVLACGLVLNPARTSNPLAAMANGEDTLHVSYLVEE
jgi:anti-sigma-K factor RskA